jgi:D-alanyl-D-alanine dipeptidase
MDLVHIVPPALDIDLRIAYATRGNFTGRPVYARADCWLHRDAVERLAGAVVLARQQGLRVILFDAFRPQEAQWILWTHTPNPDFLADPRLGSPHSRGVAVDLTLADQAGQPLDMGTAFDDFTERSYHGCTAVSPQAQANRHLLLGIMTAAGFDFYRHEWWHYQLFRVERYPLLSDSVLPRSMMRG